MQQFIADDGVSVQFHLSFAQKLQRIVAAIASQLSQEFIARITATVVDQRLFGDTVDGSSVVPQRFTGGHFADESIESFDFVANRVGEIVEDFIATGIVAGRSFVDGAHADKSIGRKFSRFRIATQKRLEITTAVQNDLVVGGTQQFHGVHLVVSHQGFTQRQVESRTANGIVIGADKKSRVGEKRVHGSETNDFQIGSNLTQNIGVLIESHAVGYAEKLIRHIATRCNGRGWLNFRRHFVVDFQFLVATDKIGFAHRRPRCRR